MYHIRPAFSSCNGKHIGIFGNSTRAHNIICHAHKKRSCACAAMHSARVAQHAVRRRPGLLQGRPRARSSGVIHIACAPVPLLPPACAQPHVSHARCIPPMARRSHRHIGLCAVYPPRLSRSRAVCRACAPARMAKHFPCLPQPKRIVPVTPRPPWPRVASDLGAAGACLSCRGRAAWFLVNSSRTTVCQNVFGASVDGVEPHPAAATPPTQFSLKSLRFPGIETAM